MNAQLIANADHYFEDHLGKNLEELTRPFDDEAPCGPDLRVENLYQEIKEARRADDPSLPRGDWQIDLKRADWTRVTQLATGALSEESKDLQLSVWLLESEIKQRGLAAIAPCLTLIHRLVDEHWENLNPSIDEIERRYNIFRWMDEKLPSTINQTPVAKNLDESDVFTGADLDRAFENQHLMDAKLVEEAELSGPFTKDIETLVAKTANEFYAEQYWDAHKGLESLNTLEQKLDELFEASQAPGFSELRKQLEKSQGFAESELSKRGVLDDVLKQKQEEQSESLNDESEEQLDSQSDAEAHQAHGQKEQLNRQQAYQQLADIAHYLAEIEPHSPVPYLVMRAVEWGSYNTAELYQDLFLINKGQIDLFEMMGIIAHQNQEGVASDAQ